MQVPAGYSFMRAPIEVEEEVVTGFGRGSKQMGTPTANLRPDALFAGPLQDLPLGVYFGYLPAPESLYYPFHLLMLTLKDPRFKTFKGLKI